MGVNCTSARQKAVVGAVLGAAVGDAIGLPYEGLSPRRAERLFGPPDRYRFLFRRGMVSDDTEHTCMVMQALIASRSDPDVFTREFAKQLRWWLLGIPAGIGLATLRSTLKLCLGVSPARSGVFSAGNGPAMRSAVLGAAVDDLDLLKRQVRASTRITHTDPKAEYGALAVALAAHQARQGRPLDGLQLIDELQRLLPGEPVEELQDLLHRAAESASKGESTQDFAVSLGLKSGVSGYVFHTVPVALHACLSNHGDFRSAIMTVVCCGGDADTTGAIVGGIMGAAVGKEGIPHDWLVGLWEWQRSVCWMEHLAQQLCQSCEGTMSVPPPRLPIYGVLPRNVFFLTIVLLHGFRRLLPPY